MICGEARVGLLGEQQSWRLQFLYIDRPRVGYQPSSFGAQDEYPAFMKAELDNGIIRFLASPQIHQPGRFSRASGNSEEAGKAFSMQGNMTSSGLTKVTTVLPSATQHDYGECELSSSRTCRNLRWRAQGPCSETAHAGEPAALIDV